MPARGVRGVLTGTRRPHLAVSLSWVAVSIALSGLLTFGYFAVVTRSVAAEEYGWFGAFWSLALVIGFGAFLPVEVELARLVHLRQTVRPLPPGTLRALAAVAVVTVLVIAVGAPLLLPALGEEAALYVALLAVCLVSVPQFLLRGLLLGRGAYRTHGTVMLVDATLRVALAGAVVLWLPGRSAAAFGWTLPAAVALAHVPVLVALLRSPPRPAAVSPQPGTVGRAVAQLTVGALCGQVLLNAAPVLVAAVAAPGEQVAAAQFVACFTLVRLPLFVAVPLQSALVPSLTELQRGGDRHAVRAVFMRLLAGTAGLCVLGAGVGLLAGPALVSVLYGERYALPGSDLAVLAVGSALFVGLLVTSQALVAGARHRASAVAWCAGLLAAAVVFTVLPGLLARAEFFFAVGSAVGFVVATVLLMRGGRPAGAPAAARASPAAPGGPA